MTIIVVMSACSRPEEKRSFAAKKVPWPASFGLGRTATDEEIRKLDIDVRPDGKGLPAGSGSALKGKLIFAGKCAACHGKAGVGGPYPALAGNGTAKQKAKTIGNYWPYATTVFDYVNRAMPLNEPGSLTADEVYSLTAYLLYANKIIDEDKIIDAGTLPEIEMPARHLFVPDDRRGGNEIR